MVREHAHSHEGDRSVVRVLTLTVSDTRTSADDTSGALLREILSTAGCNVVRHEIVPDDPTRVADAMRTAIDAGDVDAVVSTGGTGIAPRDQTYEAVAGLLDKTLDGFGEAFRHLSWEQVGARAMLSRALAGTYRNAVVFALPGSTNAVRLGASRLIVPVIFHAVALLRG